jgi:hypothetical protein
MDMDLNFCLEGLKAINKEMKTENNKNQWKEYIIWLSMNYMM